MDDKLDILLEEYTLSEILEMLDISEFNALSCLIDIGLIEWAKLEDEIQWPVS